VYDSGGATGNYGNNEYCKFEYSGDAQIMRDDHEEAWGVEDHSSCHYDSLKVLRSGWTAATKYCGHKDGARAFPAAGVQVTGTTTFEWSSDYSVTGEGFKICSQTGPCVGVACQNGGTCNDSDGSCTCTSGFSGADCSTYAAVPGWNIKSGAGTCTIVGDCVVDSGGANGNYGNNEFCEIVYLGDSLIVRDDADEAWGVEYHSTCHYDFLQVGGNKYCGHRNGARAFPSAGVQVTGQTTFTWSSDYSVTDEGFKLCADPCTGVACQNGGTCSGGSCTCASGWDGVSCANDINECDASPCQNAAACSTPTHDDYACVCVSGWEGKDCANDINE
jgi:hypothetical protein